MYAKLAKGYNELYKDEQIEKLEEIKKHLKIKPTDKLLDVGCGTGISTTFFSCQTTGVDPCKEMIEQGEGNLVQAPAEKLPFKDNSFDIVLSVTALHHTDIKQAIKEIKRVAKPTAQIALTVLNKANNFQEIKNEITKAFKTKKIESKKDTMFIKK